MRPRFLRVLLGVYFIEDLPLLVLQELALLLHFFDLLALEAVFLLLLALGTRVVLDAVLLLESVLSNRRGVEDV